MTVPTQGDGGLMPERLDAVLEAIQKLEVKIAPALAKLSEHDDDLKDHETRLRVLAERVPSDLQAQLARLNERKYVSPAAVWAAIGFAVAALGVLASFLALH